MTDDPAPTASERAPQSIGLLEGEDRQFAAAVLTGSALGSWPAFTLGTYGVVFFEQHLALWAAATSVFLALGWSQGPRVLKRRRRSRCSCPRCGSCWPGCLPVGGTSGIYTVLFWFGVVITVIGLPALAAVMVRLLIPGAERLRGKGPSPPWRSCRDIMLVSFGISTQHPRILTCRGLHHQRELRPENCSSGTGTTAH